MKRSISSLAFIAVTAAGSLAQIEAPQPINGLGSVYLGGGFFSGEQALYRQDIALIAPGSILLAGGLEDHDYWNDPYPNGSGLFAIAIGLHPFRQGDQPGPELRLGFLYTGREYLTGYLQRTTRTPYDTLTSSQTGEQYFVDSVYRSDYWIEHSAERFGLDASLIWRTKGRWSVYGGIGLAGGVLMNARTEVFHQVYSNVEGVDQGYPGEDPAGSLHVGDIGRESYRNGTGWWMGLQVPIGLDFQIARRGDFWTRMHLYYELRPQLLFQSDPELGTATSFGAQSQFGVRFKL